MLITAVGKVVVACCCHWCQLIPFQSMVDVLCNATTSLRSLFLNSVPLSIKIFILPSKGQAMWFLYAVTTLSAAFVFNGIDHVNPVSIQQAVNAKRWPLLLGGWNSPIKSIQMKSIGDMEGRKSFLLNFTFSDLCSMHTQQSLQCCQTFSLIFFQ